MEPFNFMVQCNSSMIQIEQNKMMEMENRIKMQLEYAKKDGYGTDGNRKCKMDGNGKNEEGAT